MEFRSFQISRIGDLLTNDQFGWVAIDMSFSDDATKAYPDVEVKVPIQYTRNQTIDEIHKAAFGKALLVIQQAAKVLSEEGLENLRERSDQAQKSEAYVDI